MFEFALPWIFLFLPLPFFIYWKMPPAKPTQKAAIKVPFYDKIIQSETNKKTIPSFFQRAFLLPFFIWSLLVIAAAGPRWLGHPVGITQRGRNIMLALDISGSMRLKDLMQNGKPVSRLAIVKSVGLSFIEKRKGDKIGLILFGTRAYLQTPLTFDTPFVKKMLADATIGLAGQRTAIGDAIGLAIKRFNAVTSGQKILILLTDGTSNTGVSPLSAARLAAQYHVKIYTIGFGGKGIAVPGLFGPQWISAQDTLDESTLKRIAGLTGGRYYRTLDPKGLNAIYDKINALEPLAKKDHHYRPITPLYPWPLGAAWVLILLYGFYRLPITDGFMREQKTT